MPNRLSGVAIRRKREIPLLTAAVSFAAVSLVQDSDAEEVARETDPRT